MTNESVGNARAGLEQINSVTLPKIYREIGRRVAKSPKPPAALKHHFDSIARLKPAADAKNPAAVEQLREVYAALGREAVEKYGDKAVPRDLATHLADAVAKQKLVDDEVATIVTIRPSVRRRNRSSRRLYLGLGLAVAAITVAGVTQWPRFATLASSTQHPRSTAKTGTPASGNSPDALSNDVDPAVLLVLGKTSDANSVHGFAGVDLGETYAQVDQTHELEPDRLYPWVFRSSQHTRGVECVFDEKGLLRAVTQVINGGPEQHGEGIIGNFGQTPYDEITRVTNSANSRTTAKLLYYVFPLAQTITVVQFSDTRYVRYRQVESMAETHVTVVDLSWAMPILVRSAELKRPLLEWMREAADIVAGGSFAVGALPDVPSTVTRQDGKEGEQFVLMLDDKTPDGKRPRDKETRRIANVQCLPKAAIAAMPGRAGLDVNFENYGLLAGDVFLKGDIPDHLSSLVRGEALLNTPGLAVLDDEITRVLLQEYFPPDGGRYRFEESESNGGAGQYRWTSKNRRGDVFEVVCSTNGSSSVSVIGTQ